MDLSGVRGVVAIGLVYSASSDPVVVTVRSLHTCVFFSVSVFLLVTATSQKLSLFFCHSRCDRLIKEICLHVLLGRPAMWPLCCGSLTVLAVLTCFDNIVIDTWKWPRCQSTDDDNSIPGRMRAGIHCFLTVIVVAMSVSGWPVTPSRPTMSPSNDVVGGQRSGRWSGHDSLSETKGPGAHHVASHLQVGPTYQSALATDAGTNVPLCQCRSMYRLEYRHVIDHVHHGSCKYSDRLPVLVNLAV